MLLVELKVAGDPEAVARDEDAVEDDGPALGVEGDALGLEGRHARGTLEVASLAPPEADGRNRLVGPLDRDAELELEGLTEWRAIEVGFEQRLAEARGHEGVLQSHRA